MRTTTRTLPNPQIEQKLHRDWENEVREACKIRDKREAERVMREIDVKYDETYTLMKFMNII
jgi:hypothetical protein